MFVMGVCGSGFFGFKVGKIMREVTSPMWPHLTPTSCMLLPLLPLLPNSVNSSSLPGGAHDDGEQPEEAASRALFQGLL